MALLASHLEQISASAKTIAELEFPPPKIFTNALLNNHEITTLIRDTEPHERALFSLDPNALSSNRRRESHWQNGFDSGLQGRKSGIPATHPLKQSAVSRALGDDMLREIRQSSNARHGGINVEVLLRGAERLCEVYSVAGAADKIRTLRHRHGEVASSLSLLEEKVAKQQLLLDRKNAVLNDAEEDYGADNVVLNSDHQVLTEQDFQLEEDEIRELEAKKKALEDRVSGLQKDLGGLLT